MIQLKWSGIKKVTSGKKQKLLKKSNKHLKNWKTECNEIKMNENLKDFNLQPKSLPFAYQSFYNKKEKGL